MNTEIIFAILPQLSMALLLGGLLGIERTMAGKTAGMRTYALVSMGSAMFIIISQLFSQVTSIALDPLRLAPNILVGVGFIGAGLVVLQGGKVTGITSAAGLWVSAAIGMACGFGLYSVAFVGTILTLIVFTILWLLERYVFKKISYENIINHNHNHNEGQSE